MDISLDAPFAIATAEDFNALAMRLFHEHARNNTVYRGFLHALGRTADAVHQVDDIPFLPISLFRDTAVKLDGTPSELVFRSSGTTESTRAQHHVPWPHVYDRSLLEGFGRHYGDPTSLRILALLPSYLERPDSSLVYMADQLIQASDDPLSGFHLHDLDALADLLIHSEAEGVRTVLIGVTFALLDLAERHPMELQHTIIVETGGMKGRRKEMVREAVHGILCKAFQVDAIHSEYGMTELLSQAWSKGEGNFRCPPWMRVSIRDAYDPFQRLPHGRTGGIDVIDLCNIGSCPFISTQDLGRAHADGTFEVLGRFDASELRGCNLLVAE